MSDIAARELTAREWAEKVAGLGVDQIAIALSAAERRGERRGLDKMRGAADHFEIAYRYAANAHKAGADAGDLLASAEIFASKGYDALKSNQ